MEGYTSLVESLNSISFEELCELGEGTALRLLWAREEAARFELTNPAPGFHIKPDQSYCQRCITERKTFVPRQDLGVWGRRLWGSTGSTETSECSKCAEADRANSGPGSSPDSWVKGSDYSGTQGNVCTTRSLMAVKLVEEQVSKMFAEELGEARRYELEQTSDDTSLLQVASK